MKAKKGIKSENLAGWLFLLIPIICVTIFSLIPIIQSFYLSFQSGKGNNLTFNGIGNYQRLFSDTVFLTALKNTMTYLIIQVPIMMVLALVMAVLLNDNTLKGRAIFRTAIFLPCVTSLVAYSVVFKSMLAPSGIVNETLLNLHIIKEPIGWLIDAFWAKVTIIVAITWRWTGYDMIFYLAALQSISPEIYEASKIDGANSLDRFFKITVPCLKPIILFTAIMSTIGTLQLFDEVVNLTGGGPSNATLTIAQYIYNLSFKYVPQFGYASTVSYAVVIIVVVLSIIQFKVAGDKNE